MCVSSAADWHYLIGNTIQNNKNGIFLDSSDKVWIGLWIGGAAPLYRENIISSNTENGIRIENCRGSGNIEIGYNTISSSASGISIKASQAFEIFKNTIGPGNQIGIKVALCNPPLGVQNFIFENTIQDNSSHAIEVEKSSLLTIGGEETAKNLIKSNGGDGVHVFGCVLQDKIPPVLILSNEIGPENSCGIYMEDSEIIQIWNNKIHNNNKDGVSLLRCQSCQIYDNISILSNKQNGMALNASHKNEIGGNDILENGRNGIVLIESNENQIPPKVKKQYVESGASALMDGSGISAITDCNNIKKNGGHGIRIFRSYKNKINCNTIYSNKANGIQISKSMENFASGPGGDGPGGGERIHGQVDFNGWRTAPVSLIVSGQDTTFVRSGKKDSLNLFFINWQNRTDKIDVTVTDELGWFQPYHHFVLALNDSAAADTALVFTVSPNVPSGTVDKVMVTAVSQNNSSVSDSDSFYVLVYDARVAAISLTPQNVLLRSSMQRQFTALCTDSLGRSVDALLSWQTNGGTISQTGLFTSGTTTGDFWVEASDPVSTIAGRAAVKVFPELAVIKISPESASVQPNHQCQFTAHGYNNAGEEIAVLARWQATGGTISPAGLYTAGSDSGNFNITVEDTLSRLASTTPVRITLKSAVHDQEQAVLPSEFALVQNYPNPFNPVTTIGYAVKENCHVLLE